MTARALGASGTRLILVLATLGFGLLGPRPCDAKRSGAEPAARALPEVAFEKYELSNGLDVILHEDHSLPVVSINIWYHVGSKNEKPGRTGFAHLFEHMMFQGSEHYDGEYFTPIEDAGGDVNGSTTEDRTNYWENLPSNYLETGLWLEADRMGHLLPAMTQTKLDNQRDVVKNERRQGIENQPYNKAYDLMPGLVYPPEHPYSWIVIGSMEDLTAASLDDVKDFFRTYYTPNNASLCIAGDFDPAEAKRLVEKYFAPIPPGPAIDRLSTWVPAFDGMKRATIEDNVELPKIFMIWHSPAQYTPGDAEMDMVARVLASGKTSRLYKALVYEQEIAQDVSAYQDSREIGSTFIIEVSAREGHTLEEVEAAIDAELSRLLARGVKADELALARTAYEAGFVRALERVGGFYGRADILNAYNTFLGDPGRFEWDLARYTRLKPGDVTRVAREQLDLGRRVILKVVPQSALAAGDTAAAAALATMPTAKAEPAFKPPAIQRTTLSNGLEVLLVEDHRLPIVQANLVVKGGWSADPLDRLGAGSLTAELLDEGTKTRSALEISEAFDALGAEFDTWSGRDACQVSLNALRKNLTPALAIMADVVVNPTFPDEELERQRKSYLGRIQQESKEPFSLVQNALYKTIYGPRHPYSQPASGTGTEATVSAITRQDLVNYYEATFAPSNAAVVLAGDIMLDEAVAELERAFRAWPARDVARIEVPEPPAITETRVYIVDKPGAPQSVIGVGHPGVPRKSADYAPLQVVNNALGGQATSRINLNLREDKGYSYGAGTIVLPARGKGPFLGLAPVQAQSTKEALVEIMKELRDIREGRPLDQAEVDDSKNNLVRSYPQEFQTLGAIAGKLSQIVMYDLPDDEWTRYIRDVAATSPARAMEVTKKYIHPEAAVIVVVGDREKIEPGIRSLNLGKLEEVATRD